MLAITLAVLYALDLLTTGMLDPSYELNPLMALVWKEHGFGSVVAMKAASLIGMLAATRCLFQRNIEMTKRTLIPLVVLMEIVVILNVLCVIQER